MTDKTGIGLSDAYCHIAMLAGADGVENIGAIDGCWERAVGDWWIAVNGHREPATCSRAVAVPPFAAYLEFNGHPAGLIHPYGGVIATGALANEDTFIAALTAAIGGER